MTVRVERPDFADLVSPDAELTFLASGYVFTEGPVWNVSEQALYYSDIPDDRRYRWTESTGAELTAFPTFKGNGMAYDVEGRLIVCEHVSSSISRFHADGFRETVCFHHGGVYLNSPNDLVSRARDGYIYFTDPDYGRWNDWIGSSASRCSASRPCSGCRTRAARPSSSPSPASSSNPTACASRPTSH